MFGLFSGKPSKKAFAKMFADEARSAGYAGPLQFDEALFTIQAAKGQIYLGNAYAEYCEANKERRKGILARFAALLTQNPAEVDREEALEKAVALVRERVFLSSAFLHANTGDAAPTVASEPVTNWFGRAIGIDFPTRIHLVLEKDLERWGLTFDELFGIGLERIRAATPIKFTEENGIFTGAWDDDYEGSRLLLPNLFRELPIDGEPVLVHPNRRVLMVTGSRNPGAIGAMLEKAYEHIQTKPRPQNPSLLTYTGGKLIDFTVGAGSPLFGQVERARRLCAVSNYDRQARLLDDHHKKSGKDIYVAKHTLMRKLDGSHYSYAVWTKGIPILLPRADSITFVDPGRPEGERTVASGDFRKVLEVAGDLMLDTGMFPPRYYVSRFPTEEQLQALRKG